MMYVDPKDQEITTDDSLLYKVWEERRKLRLDHFRLGKEIEELEKFIAMYVSRVNPKYQPTMSQIGVTLTATTSAESGTAWVGGQTF